MKAKEDELFKEWKKKRNRLHLVPDGAVTPDSFIKNKIKVLYVLKEVHGKSKTDSNWDLRGHLADKPGAYTWNNISRWQYGIEHYHEKDAWNKVTYVDASFRKSQLSKVAVLNLKKEPGGASSKMGEIWKYAWNDREFLKRQINLYSPDVIVCCGTGDIVKEYKLVDDEFFKTWQQEKLGLEFHVTQKKRIIIKHAHPQSWKNNQELFSKLTKTLDAIQSSIK